MLKVLDLSYLLPGPYFAWVLREQGASVVKVELPQHPDPAAALEPGMYRFLNEGKRVLPLDYTREPGKARLKRLLSSTDVLVEGFRPGALEKRGLGPKALLTEFPRLVYVSISGYGSTGPRVAGHDLNYQAVAGVLTQSTVPPPIPAADLGGALFGAVEALAALRRRDASKKPLPWKKRWVDLSMTDAARRLNVLERTCKRGRWWSGGNPFYAIYACKNGGKLAVGALEPNLAIQLLRELGLTELEPLVSDPYQHHDAIQTSLAAKFLEKTRGEWTDLLAHKEAAVTPVLPPT